MHLPAYPKLEHMTRPELVWIGGYEWSVVWKSPKQWKKDGHSDDAAGETHPYTLEIHILDTLGLHPVCEREVLLHELLHAALATGGCSSIMKHTRKADAEEVLIQGLTPMVLGILLNNPDLVAYLLNT